MVQTAIEKNFIALGFSGHTYDPTSLSYCIRDMAGYMEEVKRVREKYKNQIQIYLGIEEESTCWVNRADFDYILGSSHKFYVDGKAYDVDGSPAEFDTCLALFEGDELRMAETYFREFTEYVLKRKPDIVGHFDLLTKFEERGNSSFFQKPEYHRIAETYLTEALGSGCVFEVNTGAISRGYRTSPYPHERLLHVMKKNDAKLILTSDCHNAKDLDCHFEETKQILRDVGIRKLYTIYDHEWVTYSI